MKRNKKLVVVLAILVLGGSAFAAHKSANSKGKLPVSQPDLVFNRKLVSTSFVEGEADLDLPASTFESVDAPLKFTCPAGGCTISAEIHLQLGFGTTTGNAWSMCAELDGVDLQPSGCPYVGEVAADGAFTASSFTFVQSGVKAGTHNIQSFVFCQDGALLANYSITYRLYTP